MTTIVEYHGIPVLVLDAEGPVIAEQQDVLDRLIGAAYGRADVVAVPVERLDERFFDLGTGFAGEVTQKCVQYGMRLVILGDISSHTAAGTALPALVRESNRGRHIWFLADTDELADRLAPSPGTS
ncbi:hypothetical protein GCM10027160_39020 [Streptomyces calidiresistens]|uniref:DUF4180 domain-containing protein n=1 Tax=Streptomyces calidiresistens TaxID=1485586 RepID=A0A7W3T3E2_9ACTN|nr:DUF4180 domain-containing protein [Streptomyces calidiresistens]MBB0230193.1 DUF4180 domain-containing protein [Streptomyces calidiresistens]